MMAFDLRAGSFDQFAVVNSGRASGHAGHTAEAGVKVADPLRVDGCVAFAGEFHEVDAAARGIHLFVPENVRRADRQAKAAVDAIFDDLFGRRMMRVERAGR